MSHQKADINSFYLIPCKVLEKLKVVHSATSISSFFCNLAFWDCPSQNAPRCRLKPQDDELHDLVPRRCRRRRCTTRTNEPAINVGLPALRGILRPNKGFSNHIRHFSIKNAFPPTCGITKRKDLWSQRVWVSATFCRYTQSLKVNLALLPITKQTIDIRSIPRKSKRSCLVRNTEV